MLLKWVHLTLCGCSSLQTKPQRSDLRFKFSAEPDRRVSHCGPAGQCQTCFSITNQQHAGHGQVPAVLCTPATAAARCRPKRPAECSEAQMFAPSRAAASPTPQPAASGGAEWGVRQAAAGCWCQPANRRCQVRWQTEVGLANGTFWPPELTAELFAGRQGARQRQQQLVARPFCSCPKDSTW